MGAAALLAPYYPYHNHIITRLTASLEILFSLMTLSFVLGRYTQAIIYVFKSVGAILRDSAADLALPVPIHSLCRMVSHYRRLGGQ